VEWGAIPQHVSFNINPKPKPDELILQSRQDTRLQENHPLYTVNPEELIGRLFHNLPEKPDGSHDLAFIHKVIEEHQGLLMRNPNLVKLKYTANNEVMEDLLSYNKALEYMSASDLIEEPQWKYNRITGHKVMKPSDEDYKGATINLEIEWRNNTRSYESLLSMIEIDADTMCYKYALDNNLLNTPHGWKKLKK
jgi:hypothetical protein